MITKQRLFQWICVVCLLGLTACGGPPKWVSEGSGVMNKDDSKSIYGVGSVIGVKNEPLAWETAENRARAELAKTFRTYTAYLMQDYAASTTAGNFTKSTEEQNVERAIKTFSAVTLPTGFVPLPHNATGARYKQEAEHRQSAIRDGGIERDDEKPERLDVNGKEPNGERDKEEQYRYKPAACLPETPENLGLKQHAFAFDDLFDFFLAVPGFHVIF